MNNYKLINNIYITFDDNLNLVDGQSLGTIRQTDNLSTILTVYVPNIDDASDSCYLSITLPVDYHTKIRIPKTMPELFEYSHRENDISYYKCSFKLDSRIAKYPGQVKINLVILHDTGDYKTVESADEEKVPVEIVLTRNSETMLLNVLQSSNYYVLDLSTEEEQEEALEILSALTNEYAALPLKYLEKEKGIIKLDALPKDLTGYKNKVIFSLNDKKMFLVNNHLELIDLFVNKEQSLVNKGKINDGDDLNNYTTIGIYQWNAGNFPQNDSSWVYNAPLQNGYGILVVLSADEHLVQELHIEDLAYYYKRSAWKGADNHWNFKEWEKFLEKPDIHAKVLGIQINDNVLISPLSLSQEDLELMKKDPRNIEFQNNNYNYRYIYSHKNHNKQIIYKSVRMNSDAYNKDAVFSYEAIEVSPSDGRIIFHSNPIALSNFKDNLGVNNKLDKQRNLDYGLYAYKVASGDQLVPYNLQATRNSFVVRDDNGVVFTKTNESNPDSSVSIDYLNKVLQHIIEVAEGKTNTYSLVAQPYPDCVNELFATNNEYVELNGTDKLSTGQGTITVSDLKIGDIILIRNTGYPDRWLSNSPAPGVYLFDMLESRKIDLTDVYNKIDRLELTKLYKDTSSNQYYRVYGIFADGTQTTFNVTQSVVAGAIARYANDGGLKVNTPNTLDDAVNKKYADEQLEKKLDKITTATAYNQVYGKTVSGTQYLFNAYNGTIANSLVLRDNNGFFKVKEPTEPEQPTSKKYVDALVENTLELELDQKFLTDEQYARIVANPNSIIILIDTVMFRCVRETANVYIFISIFMGNNIMANHVLTIDKTTKQVIRSYQEGASRNYVHEEIEKHLVIDTSVRPIILSENDYNTIVNNINSIVLYVEQIRYRFVKESDVSYQFSASYIDSHELMHVYRISINKTTHEVLTLYENVITKRLFDQEYTKLIKQFTKLKKENYIHNLKNPSALTVSILNDEHFFVSFTKDVILLLAEKTYRYRKHFTGEEVFGPHTVLTTSFDIMDGPRLSFILGEIFGISISDFRIDPTNVWVVKHSELIDPGNDEIYLEELLNQITTPDFASNANMLNNRLKDSICIRCRTHIQQPLEDYIIDRNTPYQIRKAIFDGITNTNFSDSTCWNFSKWIKYIIKPVINYSTVPAGSNTKHEVKYISGTYGIKLVFKILFNRNSIDDIYLFIKMNEVRLK